MRPFIDADMINEKLADRARYFEELAPDQRAAEMIKEVADELTQLNATLQLIAANVGGGA